MGAFSGTMMCVGMMIGSGIFSSPATVLGSVGSVGMTVIVFVIGALVSLFGVFGYLEMGTMRPVSGGEKEYLDYSFPKSKALWAFLFTQSMVWLVRPGACAADSVAFGQYLMYSFFGTLQDLEASGQHAYIATHYDWIARGIGILCIISITLIHGFAPKWGIKLEDGFTVIKTLLLLIIVITGILAAAGVASLQKSHNFDNSFQGTSSDPVAYATALFGVFFAYDGWNNLNYSLDELKDPIRNLPISALSAIGLTSFLYIFATISYFIVVPIESINTSSTILAGQFFEMTMGSIVGQKIVPFIIGLSCFGCVMCMSFSSSRLILSAAREGYYPRWTQLGVISKYGSPFAALLLHCAMTLVLMLAPPPGETYRFLLELTGYPEWIFYGVSVVGLLYMRFTRPNEPRPFKSLWITNLLFIVVCIFLAIFPFVPPETPKESSIPYYLYALLGVLWILLTVPWWYYQIIVQRGLETSIKADIKERNYGDLKTSLTEETIAMQSIPSNDEESF